MASSFYTTEESCSNELYVSEIEICIQNSNSLFKSGLVHATIQPATMEPHSQTCSITKS